MMTTKNTVQYKAIKVDANANIPSDTASSIVALDVPIFAKKKQKYIDFFLSICETYSYEFDPFESHFLIK